ncbi:MAG: hypothetical protein PHY93_05730 [Bacteriovorax sp.]|nr:hypothetical protein [Bacteriovorax sp.]
MRKLLFFAVLLFSLPILANELDPILSPGHHKINDQAEFRALVSCLSEAKTSIKNPNACIAPIIYIMSGLEAKWFSVTGADVGDEKSL